MRDKMKKRWSPVVIVMCSLVLGLRGADVSKASMILGYDPWGYDLKIFTTDGSHYDDPRLDLNVQVSSEGDGVRFEIHNDSDSTIASSIARIYFDDDSLLGSATIYPGAGTLFSQDAVPINLPSGQNLIPPFETSWSFGADPPPSTNGVEPDELVAIVFELMNDGKIGDAIEQLNSGRLRVGVHVISLPDGSSESAVNEVVPEPATLLVLVVSGLVALTARSIRRYQITDR